MNSDVELALDCKGLSKRFGRIMALNRFSLKIKRGCVFGLLGPNGAGKTTFIRICKGILRPTEGEVLVRGLSVREYPERIKAITGLLPENATLFPRLTAKEYLNLIGALYKLSKSKRERTIDKFLAAFDLKGRPNDLLEVYSQGMKQKVMIIGTLLHDPEIVFLDDPFNSLDVRSSQTLRNLLVIFRKEHKTVIICSHIIPIVEDVCDEVAIINLGRLIAQGSPTQLMEEQDSKSLEEAYLQFLPEEVSSQNLEDLYENSNESF